MKKVVIIGGGIAGLTASIILARKGVECVVIEKKSYPFHRVCGEYISNEAVPFLNSLDLYPGQFNPPQIGRFQLSAVSGKNKTLPLDMGGFGISRYAFDNFLFSAATASGVTFKLNTTVESVEFLGQSFIVRTKDDVWEAEIVMGCFGKRSNLDARLDRAFMKRRSPYVGVKYHARMEFPDDLVALHNFAGGYCGVSRIENEVVNICYLVHREKLRQSGSIAEMEKRILGVNPMLKEILENATFIFEKPEVINEISFEKKLPVENHILMLGDAAGLITPLCGNGMAMAIHSAKIAAEAAFLFLTETKYSRGDMELEYARRWEESFSRRLFNGRQIQRLFGSDLGSSLAVNLALYFRPIALEIIRNTHGKAF